MPIILATLEVEAGSRVGDWPRQEYGLKNKTTKHKQKGWGFGSSGTEAQTPVFNSQYHTHTHTKHLFLTYNSTEKEIINTASFCFLNMSLNGFLLPAFKVKSKCLMLGMILKAHKKSARFWMPISHASNSSYSGGRH
jgi:hypothetical protein